MLRYCDSEQWFGIVMGSLSWMHRDVITIKYHEIVMDTCEDEVNGGEVRGGKIPPCDIQ